MTIDLVVVDDMLDWATTVSNHAQSFGLTSIFFTSGVEALEYLRSLNPDKLPKAYLCDMKLVDVWNLKNITPTLRAELEAPQQIHDYLKEYDRAENFRFMTGGMSPHDMEVQRKTGVEVYLKGRYVEEIEPFIKQLSEVDKHE